jgi:hypothetical protein
MVPVTARFIQALVTLMPDERLMLVSTRPAPDGITAADACRSRHVAGAYRPMTTIALLFQTITAMLQSGP